MIYNKSNHPVEIKRIPVRIWALRDEIEVAITRRIEECEAAGLPLFVEDIKSFYGIAPQLQLTDPAAMEQAEAAANSESVDDMMQALGDPPETLPEQKEEAATPESFTQAETILAQEASQPETQKVAPQPPRPYRREAPELSRVSYGFVLLSDINMTTLLAFSKEKFTQGQSIVIEFLIPQGFMIGAEVVLCNHYAMRSRIISATKPNYRLQSRFTFKSKGERTDLRALLKSIEPNLPTKSAARAPAPEEDAGLDL